MDTMVYNGSNELKAYRNGSLVGTSTSGVDQGNLNTQGTRANFLFGARTTSQVLSCQIGCIHIYNRALSASEVLFNYNGLKSRFGL